MYFHSKLYKDKNTGKLFILLKENSGWRNQSLWQPVKKLFWRIYVKDGQSLMDWKTNFEKMK